MFSYERGTPLVIQVLGGASLVGREVWRVLEPLVDHNLFKSPRINITCSRLESDNEEEEEEVPAA